MGVPSRSSAVRGLEWGDARADRIEVVAAPTTWMARLLGTSLVPTFVGTWDRVVLGPAWRHGDGERGSQPWSVTQRFRAARRAALSVPLGHLLPGPVPLGIGFGRLAGLHDAVVPVSPLGSFPRGSQRPACGIGRLGSHRWRPGKGWPTGGVVVLWAGSRAAFGIRGSALVVGQSSDNSTFGHLDNQALDNQERHLQWQSIPRKC
jgi:hypothetical protein